MCRSMHLYPFLLILPVISITEEWGGDDEERSRRGEKKGKQSAQRERKWKEAMKGGRREREEKRNWGVEVETEKSLFSLTSTWITHTVAMVTLTAALLDVSLSSGRCLATKGGQESGIRRKGKREVEETRVCSRVQVEKWREVTQKRCKKILSKAGINSAAQMNSLTVFWSRGILLHQSHKQNFTMLNW